MVCQFLVVCLFSVLIVRVLGGFLFVRGGGLVLLVAVDWLSCMFVCVCGALLLLLCLLPLFLFLLLLLLLFSLLLFILLVRVCSSCSC